VFTLKVLIPNLHDSINHKTLQLIEVITLYMNKLTCKRHSVASKSCISIAGSSHFQDKFQQKYFVVLIVEEMQIDSEKAIWINVVLLWCQENVLKLKFPNPGTCVKEILRQSIFESIKNPLRKWIQVGSVQESANICRCVDKHAWLIAFRKFVQKFKSSLK